MRKITYLLFISIVLIGFYHNETIAQEYLPTALEGSHRVVARFYQDPQSAPIPEMISQWEYKCIGEININDTLYKKVYKRNLKINTFPYEPLGEYILFRYLRDDVENKKVYVRAISGGAEVLLYDFSLEAGEYVNLPITDNDVDYVSNVYSGSAYGYQTNYFDFAEGYYYMEGIGSNCGFFEIMTIVVKKDKLDIEFNSLQNYCLDGDCESIFVSTNEVDYFSNEIVVYPQPAAGIVHISLNENQTTEIQIYDIKGELIKELRGGYQIQWNCENIIPGIYFYKAISNNNIRFGKIIIQ